MAKDESKAPTVEKFDPEFRFLLRSSIQRWKAGGRGRRSIGRGCPGPITTTTYKPPDRLPDQYLHGQGLHTLPPEEFFAKGLRCPRPMWRWGWL
jgi:hypothetical protein